MPRPSSIVGHAVPALTSRPSAIARWGARSSSIYRKRNIIERYFCELKHFRRIANRFDKLARNFLATVLLTSSRIRLKTYESTT